LNTSKILILLLLLPDEQFFIRHIFLHFSQIFHDGFPPACGCLPGRGSMRLQTKKALAVFPQKQ